MKRGDLAALGELFDAYARYAVLLAHHITQDDETAEQAVHQAMLDIWRNPEGTDTGDLYARLLASVGRRATALRGSQLPEAERAPGRAR